MIFLHGVYKFGKKHIGCKNDYCIHCKAVHVTEQHQTFNMLHCFFIPVLPLGFHSNWICSHCKNDPRGYSESPVLVIVGGLLFAVVGVFFLIFSVTEKKERAQSAGLGLGFIAMSYGCYRLFKFNAKQEKEPMEIPPLTGDGCLYCPGKIIDTPYAHCKECKVRRY